MREEEATLQYFIDDYDAHPHLYDKDGFQGRGSEQAICRVRDEIQELISWL